MEEKLNRIKKIAHDFVSKLGFKAQPEAEYENDQVRLNIRLDEPALLIGKNGQNLNHLQYLLRIVINRKMGEFTYLTVDINSYKKEQEEEIKKVIEETIDRVKKEGSAQALRPMDSYKRKIVHMIIKKEEGLTTESVGQDPNRRVVIKLSD